MKLLMSVLICMLTSSAIAAGGKVPLDSAQVNLDSKQSLQNGAKLFINYCMGCHSAKYMRYDRLRKDLGLTKEQVLSEFTFDPQAKIGDKFY